MTDSRIPAILVLATAAGTLAACFEEAPRDETPPTPIDRTAQVTERPVMIGFDGPRFNACGRDGRVVNLPVGEDALSVRTAPADSASEVDTIPAGTRVAMCQRTGGWVGIVYPPIVPPTEAGDGEGAPTEEANSETLQLRGCGTSAPVQNVRAYVGPCRSGWVSENNIRLVSGRQ